jgi:hypothetical protein
MNRATLITSSTNLDTISRYSDECDCDAYLRRKQKLQSKLSLFNRMIDKVKSIFHSASQRVAFSYKNITQPKYNKETEKNTAPAKRNNEQPSGTPRLRKFTSNIFS